MSYQLEETKIPNLNVPVLSPFGGFYKEINVINDASCYQQVLGGGINMWNGSNLTGMTCISKF